MANKTLQDLQYEFDGLLKGVKRAEQLKGLKSKYAPVFKARGMKGLKSGGPIVKRKSPGKTTSPKVKKIMQDLDWTKGLSKDQIKEMISGPHLSGERRAKVKKKPSKTRKAKAGGVVKKRGGGMTRQGLSPAEEARSGTMSQAKRKKYMNKGGLVKHRNMAGVVGGGLPSKNVIEYLYKKEYES